MDETEVTIPEPEPQTGDAPGRGFSVPRKVFAVAVVAVLLIAAGVGVYLATRGEADDEVVEAEEIAVPDLRGMTLDRAGEEVLAAGLAAGTLAYAVVDESVAPSGTVLSQEPLPGEMVEPGTPLDIVLAQGPTESAAADVVADAEASGASSGSSSSSGTSGGSSSGTGTQPDQPPVLPDIPPAESIDISKLQPRIIDPGIFKLFQPTYTTLVTHEAFDSNAWQSPAITFGDKPKRILITADGPQYVPIAVWAWGPGDADWKLKTIWASFPGAFEDESGKGGTLVETFDAGAGTYTILVKLNPDVCWWKVQIQEQQ